MEVRKKKNPTGARTVGRNSNKLSLPILHGVWVDILVILQLIYQMQEINKLNKKEAYLDY